MAHIPILDIDKIIDVFGGGAAGCVRACWSAGFTLNVATIHQWASRKSIPMSGWLTISEAYRLTNGRPLNLNKFLSRK